MKNVRDAGRVRSDAGCAMSNFVIKYGRDERVKYISHLDFMRCFHRCVRRSDLQFAFSEGFNPHPIMTISQPLSVGVTSECEYMKVSFAADYTEEYVLSELSRNIPPGFTFYAAKKVTGKEIDISKIDSAVYMVECECTGIENVDLDAFLANTSLIVPKKTKSGIKDSDIREHIFSIRTISADKGTAVLEMHISIGSVYNLKPETVVAALEKYCEGFNVTFMKVHRLEMMCGGKKIL